MSNAAKPPPAFHGEIQAQLTALLYRNARTGQTVNILVATALAILSYLERPQPLLFAWWILICILSFGRWMMAKRYAYLLPATYEAHAWRTRYVFSIAASSVLWLSGVALLMWSGSDNLRFMVGMSLAGMVAGAVPVLSPVYMAFRLYATTILLGVALLSFSYATEPVHWIFGILTLVFLWATLRSAKLFNETLESSIRLGLEKSHLAMDLEQARQAAEAASYAKSRFLATMSHEIRTPMNGILGMAQLLMQPGLKAAEREDYARTILTSGQTLQTLLNDILDFSKIEAGKLALESGAFEPQQVIHETALLFAEMAAQKGLRLDAISHDLPRHRYLGDSHRLRQMLSNLVSNALKFTERGQIQIEVRETGGNEHEAVLEFSVTDTGIGIPADKRDILFLPFSQADDSTTREYGGTGLGLSIVRSLAEMMGGTVGVESQVGEGSRFWFSIRAGLVAAGEDTRHEQRATAKPASPPESSSLLSGRVLVAEDNPVNRKVITALLNKLGLTVFIAEDGSQCLDAVMHGDRIDLILMDVQMPVLDGLAATARIRAWEQENQRPALPIVALTADAFEEDRQRCLAAGMNGFLPKPVAVADLRAVLHQWLGPGSAGPNAN